MTRGDGDALLLGEWACLGILCSGPAHGFAVAARMRPDADIGRIWSLSRALTYRSLDQLERRGLVEPIAEEPGLAGGNRTILAATTAGREQLDRWLRTPVEHLRDLRSELLLKIVLADVNNIDIDEMLRAQHARVGELASAFDDPEASPDIVQLWRHEFTHAALRFLERLT
jgi:DNA-binding PadR family transcriptional regulator